NGMRVVMRVRREMNVDVVLNNLYKHSALQTTFGINTLALVNGQPRVLTLKQALEYYLEHQIEIIRRRTQFDLNKAEARDHILEGLRIALDHLDKIIELISGFNLTNFVRKRLMEKFDLLLKQSHSILYMC